MEKCTRSWILLMLEILTTNTFYPNNPGRPDYRWSCIRFCNLPRLFSRQLVRKTYLNKKIYIYHRIAYSWIKNQYVCKRVSTHRCLAHNSSWQARLRQRKPQRKIWTLLENLRKLKRNQLMIGGALVQLVNVLFILERLILFFLPVTNVTILLGKFLPRKLW